MELLRDMYESWQMMDLHNSIITMGRTHPVFETSKQVRVKWNIWNKKRCDAKRPRQQEHRSVRSSNSNQPICDNDLSSIISFPSIIVSHFRIFLVSTMILPVLYMYTVYVHS